MQSQQGFSQTQEPWSWNDPSELSCITCHYTWAAHGKETWLWVKRHSLVKATSWGGIQQEAWSSQRRQHLGEGETHQSWRRGSGLCDQCPLQGPTLIRDELVRCCFLRVWNGRQINQKWGGKFTAVLEAKTAKSCDPQNRVVLKHLLCAWLFKGSLGLIYFWHQENIKYFTNNPQGIMNTMDDAAIKMMIMSFLKQCQTQKCVQI